MSRRRKQRERVVLDAETGQPLAGFWSDIWGTNTTDTVPADPGYAPDFPVQATSNADIQKQIVPTGTTPPAYVVAVAAGFPSAYYDSWYFPTQGAIVAGHAQAAVDTVIATGDQIGAGITQIANIGANIAQNFVPILIAIAAILLFSKYGGKS